MSGSNSRHVELNDKSSRLSGMESFKARRSSPLSLENAVARLYRDETLKPGHIGIVFITHEAMERDIQACLGALRELPSVARIGTVLRVIGHS